MEALLLLPFSPSRMASGQLTWSHFLFGEDAMTTRLMVKFSDDRMVDALDRWATNNLRDPRDQIVYAVREALQKRGLLASEERKEEEDREFDCATM